MKVSVRCPHCGTGYRVAEEKLGSHAHCKQCSQTFTLTVSGSADKTFTGRAKPAGSALEPTEQHAWPPGGSPDLSPPSVPQKRTIGHYTLQRKLGTGMMGEVWLAHDPQLDRDVAIKLLPASFAKDEERLRRFLREARATARLDHPHVVTVYQAGTDAERAFIAMQYVDGDSLDKTVEANGPLDWRAATQVIREAAAGLSAAHELGMVHRDVKPANLMRSEKGITKVVDFGLVRAQVGDSHLTQDGRLLGTPAYMAPEQWGGDDVDARSDLYSLVCTYYYLLTGRVPFDAPTAPSLGYQHRYGSLPDPRDDGGPLPDGVCRILGRGLSKKPAQRYQTAEELITALDAVLASPSESLTFQAPWHQLSSPYGIVPPPAPVTTKKSDKRCTVVWNVMAATISFLALVAVLGVVLILRRPAGNEDDLPPPTPPEMKQAPALAVAPFDEQEAEGHQIAWAEHLAIPRKMQNTIGMTLVLIPPGEFKMGSPEDPAYRDDECPKHKVRITKPFYLGQYEVTQGQYAAVMNDRPWSGQGEVREGPDVAASYVSWTDAVEFCRRLSQKESQAYFLPTEAQWEYACRGGTTTTYHFGDDASQLVDHAWCHENARAIGEQYAHQVGQKKANPFGLYDMYGNVWEWCADWYDNDYYAGSRLEDPIGAAEGSGRVTRGGSWDAGAGYRRSAFRGQSSPGNRSYRDGFRVALVPSASPDKSSK